MGERSIRFDFELHNSVTLKSPGVGLNIVVVCYSSLVLIASVQGDSANLINKHQTDNGDPLQGSHHATNAVNDTFTGVLPTSNGVTTHFMIYTPLHKVCK